MKNIFIVILVMISYYACSQKPITNGMSGLNARNAINSNFDTLYNQKDAYVNVLDFGAVGDGVTDDQAALQEALDSAALNDKILWLDPGRTYYSGTAIEWTNATDSMKSLIIEGNNSVIITDLPDSARLMRISGAIGDYHTITTTITEDRNWLVCNSIALELEPGDLIKVISSQPFNDTITYYNEEAGRGEMKIVRNVVDSFIYVSEPFFDTYSTDDWYDGRDTALNWKTPTIQVAEVYPVKVIINNLTLENRTTDYSEVRIRGFDVGYLIDSKININIYNFVDYAMSASDCFNTHFDVNIYNTPRGSWGVGGESPGYGFNLLGASIGCLITGNISNARHCFTYNVGNSMGVGWNNTVSINGYSGMENPIIDCHGPCGSIYIRDCHLFGGNIVSVGTSLTTTDPETDKDNRSRGIELGARHNYITDCYFYNVNYIAISTRRKSEVHDLIINNVVGENCGLLLLLRAQNEEPASFINNIIIDGVSGTFGTILTGNFNNVDTFYKGERFTISNVYGNVNGLRIIDPDIKRLFLNNWNVNHSGADSSFLIRDVESVYVDNFKIKGWENHPFDLQNVDNLYINNCVFDSTDSRIVNYTEADGSGTFPNVDTIAINVSMTNTTIINSIGTASNGIFYMPDSSKFINLHFENNIVDFNQYLMSGAESGADNLYIGNNQLPSGFVDWHTEDDNFTTKYYANAGGRKIIGGNGSPEGVAVAKPGSMYLREDGAANTTLYIKGSGAGNTGWVAK